MTVFRRMLNLFGAYVAFAPLLYFIISLFTASVYKSVIAFGLLFVACNAILKIVYRKKVKTNGKAVLITGCDSGFGFVSSHTLASYGMVVFSGCLDVEKSKAKLQFDSSKSKHGTGLIIPIQLDVTKQDQVDRAKELVDKELISRDLSN